MNYLAHLALSGENPEIRLGNLIADWIRTPDLSVWPVGIANGIRLHRKIDGFTDRHPVVHRAWRRLDPSWNWYAGIIIDIHFDHLLCRNFTRWMKQDLESFIEEVHQQLLLVSHQLAEPIPMMLQRLIDHDRLRSYQTLEGIEEALRLTTLRLRERMPDRAIDLVKVVPELRRLDTELMADFVEFYDELNQQASLWRTELTQTQ
jgi:acyl carrier protein phosphodiesterase